MHKYFVLLKLSWQNGFVYRTSVVLWRLRQFLSTFMAITVWIVIFSGTEEAFQYSRDAMISYIFLVSFLQSLVLSSSLNGLANRVYSGEISNLLLKPVNLFSYFASEELADKLKNVGFLLLETVALYFIFQPMISLPNLPTFAIFVAWSILAVLLNFFVTLIFGSIGFWSPQTWGPRFLFFMIVNFTAGKLFPLDILPTTIQKILFYTPFPYLSFVQIQLFLNRYTQTEIISHSLTLLSWVVILGILAYKLWQRGLKAYDSAGR